MYKRQSEKYIGAYHDFTCDDNPNATLQFQLNGSLTPGFPASIDEWLEISRNAVEPNGGEIPVKTLDQFRENYFCICHRLTLPGADTRTVAGLNTRGINLSGSLNSVGLTGGANAVLLRFRIQVLQNTSFLKIW